MKMNFISGKGYRIVNANEVGDRELCALFQIVNDDGTHAHPPLAMIVVRDDSQMEDHLAPFFNERGLHRGASA